MPKNKGKGGKNRRRGKNENESEKRELVFKEHGQEYAQVIFLTKITISNTHFFRIDLFYMYIITKSPTFCWAGVNLYDWFSINFEIFVGIILLLIVIINCYLMYIIINEVILKV